MRIVLLDLLQARDFLLMLPLRTPLGNLFLIRLLVTHLPTPSLRRPWRLTLGTYGTNASALRCRCGSRCEPCAPRSAPTPMQPPPLTRCVGAARGTAS